MYSLEMGRATFVFGRAFSVMEVARPHARTNSRPVDLRVGTVLLSGATGTTGSTGATTGRTLTSGRRRAGERAGSPFRSFLPAATRRRQQTGSV